MPLWHCCGGIFISRLVAGSCPFTYNSSKDMPLVFGKSLYSVSYTHLDVYKRQGLSLADAGLLMLVTRIWDAVSDPMMGVIADRTHTRWGKYLSLIHI